MGFIRRRGARFVCRSLIDAPGDTSVRVGRIQVGPWANARRPVLVGTRLWPLVLMACAGTSSDIQREPATGEPSTASPAPVRSLRLTNKTLLYIKDNYYDASRIQPTEMLRSSLKAIETTSPTIHVRQGAQPSEILVSVGAESKTFDTSDVTSVWRLALKLEDIFDFLAAQLGLSETSRLDSVVANGVLVTLDSQCALYSEADSQRVRAETVNLAEGKAGLDRGSGKPLGSVQARLISANIGYVLLTDFTKTTALDLRVALGKLSEEARSSGRLKGVVLDLRGNQGGLLEEAIQVAGQFLADGVIVNLRTRQGTRRETKRAQQDASNGVYPLVVLVDGKTAAGAELVVGALKDRDRAMILGRRTAGVGLIQVIYQFGNGEGFLRFTIAEMFTPSGAPIREYGIEPDISLIRMMPAGAVPPLEKPIPNLNPFTTTKSSASRPTSAQAPAQLRYLWSDQEDFELVFASDVLTAAPLSERSKMLRAAGPLVIEKQKLETERLQTGGATVEVP
jgi:hypothetical protein